MIDFWRYPMDSQQQRPEREHPIVAWIGVAAIVAAILVIIWARVEVIGTRDIEAALSGEPNGQEESEAAVPREVDSAVAAGRWATGFSP